MFPPPAPFTGPRLPLAGYLGRAAAPVTLNDAPTSLRRHDGTTTRRRDEEEPESSRLAGSWRPDLRSGRMEFAVARNVNPAGI
jgi:hypothetical protein